MELRSCSHLHYMAAIKGGSEVKVLNVFRGKPGLKFKTMVDVYGTDDAKDSVAVSVDDGPKVESDDLLINCDKGRAERTCVRIPMESELDISGSNCRNGDEGGEGESDGIGALTLRQIKEGRKKRKRKHSRHVGEEVIASCSSGKQKHHHSLSEDDDEYDLMVPLISLKSRLSGRRTTKRKCRKGTSSTVANGNASNQVIVQSTRDCFVPTDVKVEVLEHIHSDCGTMNFMAIDSSSFCDESVASSGELSTERLEEAVNCVSGRRTPVIFSEEEPETVKDIVWESETAIPTSEPERTQDSAPETQIPKIFEETATLEDHIKNKLPTITWEEPKSAEGHLLEYRMPTVSSVEPPISPRDNGTETQIATILEPQCRPFSEQSYEYVEHPDPESTLSSIASDSEMRGNVAKVISHQLSSLTSSNLENVDSVIDLCSNINSSKASSPSEYCNSNMEVDSQRLPGVHEASIHDSFQDVEYSRGQDSCLHEDEAKDDKPRFMTDGKSIPTSDCSFFMDSSLISTPNGNLIYMPGNSLTTEEARFDAAGNCNQVIHSPADEPVAFADNEKNLDVKHSPERLLSTRKVISPTTQIQLRKAMETTELDDEQYYKHTRKLCYMNVKPTEDITVRFERHTRKLCYIKKSEVATSPEEVIMSPKKNRSILKVPRLSRGVAGIATKSASCPESVISFSQQQMRDIEIIASKLTKELNFMKSIVEDTLHSTSSPTDPFKHSADEVRAAIQSASKVEESAKKWVSIMGRDCNRFCKIMKSTAKSSSTTPRTAPCKEKRKIVFADEAGGKLCDVKTFEKDVALSSPSMEFVTSSTEIAE